VRGDSGNDYRQTHCHRQATNDSKQKYFIQQEKVNDFLYNLGDFTAMQCILLP
jgi:hypothetical protein